MPQGRARPAAQAPVRSSAPLGVTLEGRLVVVVEDEPAVHERPGGAAQELGRQRDLVRQPAGLRVGAGRRADDAPDLLIVDYRLEQGHTGLEAIRALRAHARAADAGDRGHRQLLSSHEHEAGEHDFHLLIKPVVPNKLRAMIAFKLGLR